jgi:hypothetical protein
MDEGTKVIVSIADSRLPTLDEVVSALREAGMVVDDVLEPLGTVIGSTGSSTVAELAAVPGVEVVEVQRDIRLPPPDAPQ